MTGFCIAVLAVVLIPKSAGFPALPTQALAMVDVHVSALSQTYCDDKRLVFERDNRAKRDPRSLEPAWPIRLRRLCHHVDAAS